jgi:hypothetical protein
MATTTQELESFTRFARERLEAGDLEPSLDELFDLWRLENPSDADYAQNVAAIAGAIEDFRNGDRGRPAGQLSRSETRRTGAREKRIIATSRAPRNGRYPKRGKTLKKRHGTICLRRKKAACFLRRTSGYPPRDRRRGECGLVPRVKGSSANCDPVCLVPTQRFGRGTLR